MNNAEKKQTVKSGICFSALLMSKRPMKPDKECEARFANLDVEHIEYWIMNYRGDTDVKKANVLLCSMTAAFLMTGCGEVEVLELTQNETDLISEYAVGVLVKNGTLQGSRLVDTAADELAEEEAGTEEPVEENIEEEPETETGDSTEVVDVSQDEEETQPMVSSVEEYYGIPNVTVSYTGYEMVDSYPQAEEGAVPFFSLDASPGTQLLVLKFNVQNVSGEDQLMDMLGYGATFRVSVNGEASKGALATMLVNDMQTYDDVIPANSSVELVSIVEVPQGTNAGSIDFILRGNEQDGTLRLQ